MYPNDTRYKDKPSKAKSIINSMQDKESSDDLDDDEDFTLVKTTINTITTLTRRKQHKDFE